MVEDNRCHHLTPEICGDPIEGVSETVVETTSAMQLRINCRIRPRHRELLHKRTGGGRFSHVRVCDEDHILEEVNHSMLNGSWQLVTCHFSSTKVTNLQR